MTVLTDLGRIEIANNVISGIAGNAAANCFGVKGMTIRTVGDGIARLLRRENQSRGVRVTELEEGGVNITSVCRSIIEQVRYHVERLTGIDVRNVDIYVESIKIG